MFELKIANTLLRRMVRYGRVSVTYWNGQTVRYVGRQGLDEPELRVEIRSAKVVQRLLVNASLAVGEGYMHGDVRISPEQLPLFFKLVNCNKPRTTRRQPVRRTSSRRLVQRRNIAHHYDVGNDYYDTFLGRTRMYSCAYFGEEGMGLDEAQEAKVDYLLSKLQLKPGMTMLDIGCGWGYVAVTAAKKYGAKVLGITLSEEQLRGARALAEHEGVSHLVTFELTNYQDLKGKNRFDRIISIGMFEHVGRHNRDKYFAAVNRLLVPGGVSVLHTITQQNPMPVNAWIDKYVFPGGYLPTVDEIYAGLRKYGFMWADGENLWRHYAETLRMWRENHQANRERIIEMFDEVFYLLRDFWLAGSEGGFRYGELGLTQIVFTKGKPADGTYPMSRKFLYN